MIGQVEERGRKERRERLGKRERGREGDKRIQTLSNYRSETTK